MTLKELWMIAVRGWKFVLAAVLVCAVVCGGYYMTKKHGSTSYTATSYIVANSQVSHVSGLAKAEARSLSATPEGKDVSVQVKPDTTTMTVTVTATSPDADGSLKAANEVAEAANAAAVQDHSNWDTPYAGTVVKASAAQADSAGNLLKYGLVAVFAGLFISICSLVALDMGRRSIKTPEGVQEAAELPVLEILPAQNGERLLANVQFSIPDDGEALDRRAPSVLVVPSGDESVADDACDLLKAAAAAENVALDVQRAEPLSQGMAGAYASRDADVVLVAVRQWKDRLPQLETTAAELRLAGANLAGIVFAKS